MSISNSPKDSYHHGDLRNALVQAGVELLAQEGVQALSLRKLARQAGVSHNAPYMHFSDKEALLAAIAEEGFHILTAVVETAVSQAEGEWQQQLRAGSWAYVQFALEHPSHLQVMFRSFEHAQYPSLLQAGTGALAQLQTLIEEGQQVGLVRAGDSGELATCVWSLLHGLATILTGRKVPPAVMGEAAPEELTRQFVDLLYGGLAAAT